MKKEKESLKKAFILGVLLYSFSFIYCAFNAHLLKQNYIIESIKLGSVFFIVAVVVLFLNNNPNGR